MKLIIIESPTKEKYYRKYLGSEYEIVASMGHVVDLPQKGGVAVDIKNGFVPKYEVMPDKKDVLNRIIEKAKKAEIVYLMSDPDREGSAIAWHIKNHLPKNVVCKRAAASSITKDEIQRAIREAGEIDSLMVDSYEARRILDRLVGFKCSFLTKQATGGPSAGRVQSSALRILAERELEIRNFKPEEYWPVQATLRGKTGDDVIADVIKPDKMDIKSEIDAKAVEEILKNNKVKVADYQSKESRRSAAAPFTTSTMQSSAASMFGWSQKQTMDAAKQLYEAGHITYLRTDSTYIVPEKVTEIRSVVNSKYGSQYLPSKAISYKGGKNAQEAHEAIRPTDFSMDVASTGNAAKLYKLIWKRSVASQMEPAVYEQRRVVFEVKNVRLSSSGSRLTFDGYRRCWDYGTAHDRFLPEFEIGEVVELRDVKYEQKFTEPPPRYGIATFNTKLDELGIARPSTLQSLTETLKSRNYVEAVKNVFHVTDLGLRVVDFLVKSEFCFADVLFTRDMEDKLDDILHEKTTKLDVLTNFWERLKGDLDRAKGMKDQASRSQYRCPECEKNGNEAYLLLKHSRFGPFYSCENHKETGCEYKADVGTGGEPVEKEKRKPAEASAFKCPECGKPLMKRSSQYGEFLGCKGYPACRVVAEMDGTIKEKKSGFSKKSWRGKKRGPRKQK